MDHRLNIVAVSIFSLEMRLLPVLRICVMSNLSSRSIRFLLCRLSCLLAS